MNKNQLLYLTILLEGYVVLACELIAIRTLIPFVGSGTEVIAIVISAVLLPLAVGYHAGGQKLRRAWKAKKNSTVSVRKILLKNLLNAMVPLTLGLSYVLQEIFFTALGAIGITHHIAQASLFCLLVLVYPVYLLAQTIPLLSNYFSKQHLSAVTGKMLFFSTLGSFAGSVFSTIVLMMVIGVHYTLIFTMGLLALLVFLLTRRIWEFDNVMAAFMLIVAYALNSGDMMAQFNIVANNQYGMTRIYEEPENDRIVMDINRSYSAAYSADPTKRFKYLQWIENNIINPAIESGEPKKFLILGAGGFTVGMDDEFNDYVYVDIDGSLQETSEKYLLPKPLGKNKKFVAMSARAFLTRHKEEYDFILTDVFNNIKTIPQEATTVEFFTECKRLLKDRGILVANTIASPAFENKFEVRYENTFREVFPRFTSQIIHQMNPWKEGKLAIDNVLYVYHHRPQFHEDQTIYTDDLNSYSLDR